jgi:hypothetical protein
LHVYPEVAHSKEEKMNSCIENTNMTTTWSDIVNARGLWELKGIKFEFLRRLNDASHLSAAAQQIFNEELETADLPIGLCVLRKLDYHHTMLSQHDFMMTAFSIEDAFGLSLADMMIAIMENALDVARSMGHEANVFMDERNILVFAARENMCCRAVNPDAWAEDADGLAATLASLSMRENALTHDEQVLYDACLTIKQAEERELGMRVSRLATDDE